MNITELIVYVNSQITSDIVEKFNEVFINEYHYDRNDNLNKCRNDFYNYIEIDQNLIGEKNNNFINKLKELGHLSEETSEIEISKIRSSLISLKRSILLQNSNMNSESSFEEKLLFSLNHPQYFRIFREYEIPNLGKFSCIPKSDDDINSLIQQFDPLINEYGFRTSRPQCQSKFSFNQIDFIIQANKNDYKKIINDRLKDIKLTYGPDSADPFIKLCYYIHTSIKEWNLDLFDFLKKSNNPIIYFITLWYKKQIIYVIEYNEFLSTFDWENEAETILDLQNEHILIEKNYSNLAIPLQDRFEDNIDLKIYCLNENQFYFFNEMKKDKIFRQDILLVQSILSETIKTLSTQNYLNDSIINDLVDSIVNNLNLFITPGLNIKFEIHFLNSFSDHDITSFNQDVWIKFKETLPFSNLKTQKVTLPKIKTNISAKQLALFIRLLFESEIIDNRKHKVEPLLQLISNYFSSVDKDDLSTLSLNKNYYSKDYHSDFLVLKAKLIEMQKHIEELVKN